MNAQKKQELVEVVIESLVANNRAYRMAHEAGLHDVCAAAVKARCVLLEVCVKVLQKEVL